MRAQPAMAAGTRIDWWRTLQAKRQQPLAASHLRFRPPRPGQSMLHCLVLDVSASMRTGQRLAQAKGMLLALFERAAQQRHHVALVCFGGRGAQLRFGPAVPRWWNARWIEPIGAGGGTPLAAGLQQAAQVLRQAGRRTPGGERWLWLFSDGRSRVLPRLPPAERRLVVDFDTAALGLRRCRALAARDGADYLHCRDWPG